MMYGCLENLQIFRMAALLFGILMEKILRVQAAGKKYTRAFDVHGMINKGNRTCHGLVYAEISGPGRTALCESRGRNVGIERKCREQNRTSSAENKIYGNKYRDRRLLVYAVKKEEKSCRVRGCPNPAVSEKKALYELQCA